MVWKPWSSENKIKFYKRQIGDIMGVWIDDPDNPDGWDNFWQDRNGACKTDWEIEDIGTLVDFIDLTIG